MFSCEIRDSKVQRLHATYPLATKKQAMRPSPKIQRLLLIGNISSARGVSSHVDLLFPKELAPEFPQSGRTPAWDFPRVRLFLRLFGNDEAGVHPVGVVAGNTVAAIGDDEAHFLEAGVEFHIEVPGGELLGRQDR